MVRVTERDERMLNWFATVRVANVEALRWALASQNGESLPVTARAAQMWCARMEQAGLIGRQRVSITGGSVVWATHAAIGLSEPHLFSQMTRHEVSVSIVSAHFLAAEYGWGRDRKPANRYDHQADGVAVQGGIVELAEVELTAKRFDRYTLIFNAFARRFAHEEMTGVTYFTTAAVGRSIENALDTLPAARSIRDRVRVVPVFDVRGAWETSVQLDWLHRPDGSAPVVREPLHLVPTLFDAQEAVR